MRQQAEERLAQRLALPERGDVAADDHGRRRHEPSRLGDRVGRHLDPGRRPADQPVLGRTALQRRRPALVGVQHVVQQLVDRGHRPAQQPFRRLVGQPDRAVGVGDEDPLAEGADRRLQLRGVAPLAVGEARDLVVEARVVERTSGPIAELLRDQHLVRVVRPVLAPQVDERPGGLVVHADGHAQAPAQAVVGRRRRRRVDLEHARPPLPDHPRHRRLAGQVHRALLDDRRRGPQVPVRRRDVPARAVVCLDVHDADVAHQGQGEAGEPAQDLLVVEGHPELATRVRQQVEASPGGLGPAQRGALGIEQSAALHRARAQPGQRGDERLPVGGERVGTVPAEAQHPEPPAVGLERNGRDRALLGGVDPEPAEGGPVTGEVDRPVPR